MDKWWTNGHWTELVLFFFLSFFAIVICDAKPTLVAGTCSFSSESFFLSSKAEIVDWQVIRNELAAALLRQRPRAVYTVHSPGLAPGRHLLDVCAAAPNYRLLSAPLHAHYYFSISSDFCRGKEILKKNFDQFSKPLKKKLWEMIFFLYYSIWDSFFLFFCFMSVLLCTVQCRLQWMCIAGA